MSVIIIDRKNNTYQGVPDFNYINDPVLYKIEREKFYKKHGLVLPEEIERRKLAKGLIAGSLKAVLYLLVPLLIVIKYDRIRI